MANIEFKQTSSLKRHSIALLLAVSALAAGLTWGMASYLSASPTTNRTIAKTPADDEQAISHVTALGHVEPQGKITHLSPPPSNQRLTELRVKEGDRVKAGQIIAVMSNSMEYQAAVENAKAKVRVAQARLAQVQAGNKLGDIEAQRRRVAEIEAQVVGNHGTQYAAVTRQEVELRRAEMEYERYRSLSGEGVVSELDTEKKRLQVEIEGKRLQEAKVTLSETVQSGRERIEGARATLFSLANVQPTDVLVAQAELEEALSQWQKAQVDLNSVFVRSPVAGQILSLNANVGEIVGPSGIADIGQTQQMYVTAEVYESDVQYVKVGQSATIVSDYGGLKDSIKGVVEQVGLQIDKPQIEASDPSVQADVRVVRVKIRLNAADSERVRQLNNLKVRASIQVS